MTKKKPDDFECFKAAFSDPSFRKLAASMMPVVFAVPRLRKAFLSLHKGDGLDIQASYMVFIYNLLLTSEGLAFLALSGKGRAVDDDRKNP